MTNLINKYKNLISIFFIILLFFTIIIILFSNNKDSAYTKNLKNIWLNISTNEIAWQYDDGSFEYKPSILNKYYPIIPSDNFIINHKSVYKINTNNELVLYKTFPNQVFYFLDDQNYIINNENKEIISVTDNIPSKYSLTATNDYLLGCNKIIINPQNNYCLSNNDGEIYQLHLNDYATLDRTFEKEGYINRNLFINDKETLYVYQKLTEISAFATEVLLEPDLSNNEIYDTTQNEFLLIQNGIEIKLENSFIYSIIKNEQGYIINTISDRDRRNKINNFTVYQLDNNNKLTILYKNTSGIILK
jgi:hypothetical protein